MEEIKLLKNAYRIYNLNDRQDLSNKILNYISTRLIANRSNFEQMIEMLNADIKFNDILTAFNNAYKEKDYYKETNSYKHGIDYYSGVFPMPIGNIVVETNDVLEVIKYFVIGIKSRNTITISQTEYDEFSLSNMILIIFVEALAKFNVSRNTLMILPFEECFYDEFDEVIVLEDGKIDVKQKEFSPIYIIYKQNDFFNDEVEKEEERLKSNNINYKIINGSLEEVLDIINIEKPESASIYTKDPNIAYNFINLACSHNVFVNSSLLNSERLNDNKNKFYYKRKVMYPSGKEIDLDEYYKNYLGEIREKNKINAIKDNNEINISISSINNLEEKDSASNMALSEVVNPWYKRIFEKIKNIFFKNKD